MRKSILFILIFCLIALTAHAKTKHVFNDFFYNSEAELVDDDSWVVFEGEGEIDKIVYHNIYTITDSDGNSHFMRVFAYFYDVDECGNKTFSHSIVKTPEEIKAFFDEHTSD